MRPATPVGREKPGGRGDDDADDERGDDAAGGDDEPSGRQCETEAVEHPLEQAGDAESADHPERRRHHADGERLDHARAEDLAARGSDGPEQRRLPRALGGQDGEGVGDAERGHEQGDAGEGQQKLRSVSRNVPLTGVMLSLVSWAPVIASHARRQDRLDAAHQLVLGHPGRGLDRDAADLVRPPGDVALGAGQAEGGVGGLAEPLGGAERGDADDVHRHRLGHLDGGRLSEPEVTVPGRALVDDDLVVGHRRAPGDQVVRVEGGVADPVAGDPRRAHAPDGLAVTADELAETHDQRLRVGHATHRAHLGCERGGDERSVATGSGFERRRAADDGVGTGVGAGEQLVEIATQGVAQGQRPGQEGHAEEHGDERADQTPLAGPQPLEGEGDHGVSPPSDLRRSKIASELGLVELVDDAAVGEEHDGVGRAAADGSWVTITTVWPSWRTARRRKAEHLRRRNGSRGCRWARRRR